MPIGLGLACSHSPNVFIAPEEWENRYHGAILDVPQPLAAAKETLEVRRAYKARIDAAFETLRAKLAEYRPDSIIMVTDDHNEMYDENLCQPSIAMFTGEEGSGTLTLAGPREDPTGAARVKVKCNRELAEFIAEGLVQRDFDIAITRTKETHSIGPRDRGMGHGFFAHRTQDHAGAGHSHGPPVAQLLFRAASDGAPLQSTSARRWPKSAKSAPSASRSSAPAACRTTPAGRAPDGWTSPWTARS